MTACRLGFRPPLRFVILGAGPEALVFARLVASLGHDHLLLSHDEMTLGSARVTGCRTKKLSRISGLGDVLADADTAVTLFYHDHDYEPELLRHFLAGGAFYIGAQGSRGAQRTRVARLQKMGVPAGQIARLRGPIGLIPSARDAQTLAVSVLAEIMAVARTRERSPISPPPPRRLADAQPRRAAGGRGIAPVWPGGQTSRALSRRGAGARGGYGPPWRRLRCSSGHRLFRGCCRGLARGNQRFAASPPGRRWRSRSIPRLIRRSHGRQAAC